MSKPKLLLDVDGTVVPFKYIHYDDDKDVDPDEVCEIIDCLIHNKWEVKVHFPHRQIELVKQLAEHFDIIWFTGWDNHARQIEHVLGMGELQIIRTNTRFKGGPRKHEALEWWLEEMEEKGEDASFVWIDDDELDLIPQSDIPDNGMVIKVEDPYIGMTQEDVDKAIEWAKERNGDSSNT